MHIPDGFLNLPTCLGSAAVSIVALKQAVSKVGQKLDRKQVPLMGVMSAFVFAAQMLNFPIIGGTSGHLIGAALLAVLLGPWTASLIMTSILLIQGLVFMDGGISALGANLLNMAVIAPWGGYAVYQFFLRIRSPRMVAAFVASWASVLFAAIACALELALSGLPFVVVLPAMVYWHLIIGIGEGVITTAVLMYVWNTREKWAEEIVKV